MIRFSSPRALVAIAFVYASHCLGGTLSDIPLSIKGAVPPNVMFALSVEFPTANTAAYQDTNNYSANTQYLGYFDDKKCYVYDSTNGWFAPSYTTTTHTCTTGGWSGNFLNWATMTGLDEFRFAMTGGNRSTDTSTVTVLERSYQSGQGGTANFPDKSYTDTSGHVTTYPAGTSLSIQNQGRGVQVAISPSSATGVMNCTSPSLTGSTFSCTLISNSNDPGTCTAWTGTGTSASPYTCTSLQIGGISPTTLSTSTTSAATNASTSTSVTCSSPGFSGSTFTCGSLSLQNGSTASCNTWTGSGSSSSPYTCTSFSTFSHGETFYLTGTPTITTAATTTPGSQVTDPSSSGRTTCTLATVSGNPLLTCALALEPGDNAICSTFSGTGASGSPYLCKGFGFTGGETYVSLTNSTSTTTFGGKTYYNKYRITYISPPTTTTYYYANSYPGATSGYYYVSQYNYGFSGSQIFNVRVKACDSTVGLENNCKQFGSSYKPTGVIQDNGSQMRFGVTSYFQANDIDNAVLRSKAKYVAPLMYSPSGGVANNARTEWSSTDGTLFSNPDSSDAATATSFIGTTSNTGVINYINKFGSTSHTYKTYDDIGKLYYETLKYLRGTKAPTRDFYNGAKSSNADGFPVINQWDDPVQFSCQKNYIITMGDAHTWCDKRLPGGSYTTVGSSTCNSYTDGNANNHAQDTNSLSGDTGVNVTTATNTIGTLENVSNLSTTQTGAGGASFYMSGLAQWAASQDIRSDFAGKQTVQTYVIDVEENKDCGFNSQFWYAAKYGNPASYDTNGNWLTTNNPWATSLTLPGGACSSRAPTGYSTSGGAVTWPADLLRASDPVGMIASVRSAITQIVAQIGDEAALAQSSGFLDTGTGAYIYRATYNSGGWMGDVQALVINTSGSISSTPAWSASTQLPTASNRNVLTFNDGRQPGGAKETSDAYALRGVAFSSSGFTNLSARQQAWLDTDSTGLVDNYGTDRVSYILGDQSKEAFLPGTTTPNPSANYGWRTRSSRLGDVINSNPVFVGPPSSGYADTTYKTFANANASRTPLVYVGGNDGMLHAFDASYTYDTSGNPQTVSTSSHISGREVFAYVPSAVYGNLSQLMSPTYSHKYYVDGSPTVGDACFSTCTNASQWKTVLIGSLNAGGQGIFALDITDPATSFTGTNVLWEFTDADDADLGFTFSRPIIRKLNNGKWAAIFGNGYNNTYADGSTSSTGRAYLYILYIDGPGAGNSWTLGTNYFKIALKSPSEGTSPTLPLSPPNGLSSAASLDIDFNGTTDYVYAGDRLGNLWKIDLTSSTPSQWKSAFTDSSNNPLPLFTAKDPSGNTQQITTGINIAPTINGRSGYMVMFGTGSWVDTTDPVGPFKTDSLYGIWDTPLIDTSTTPNTTYTTPVASRSNLQQQKVLFYVDTNGNTQDSNGNPYTPTTLVNGQAVYAVYSSCQPYYLQSFSKTSPPSMPSNISDPLCPSSIAIGSGKTGTQRGWVMDLTSESGERVRSSTPQIGDQGAKVTFTTLSPATDPCTGNTIGQEYNLATDTGGSPHSGVYVGGSQGQVKVAAAQIPGYTGTVSITVVLGGTAITGGASDNAINFNATPPTSVATTPTNSISPPTTVCSGSACPNFVPGWGFLMNLQGPTAANSRMVLSCSPPEIGTGLPNCTWKYKYGTFGRLSWRQVTH